MKSLLISGLFFLIMSGAKAQDATVREIHRVINNNISHTIRLIKQDKITELSKCVVYPVKRRNPLPNINNEKEFAIYYSVIFDLPFKKKLRRYTTSIIMEHDGLFGLVGNSFHGDLWMDDDGKIHGINIESQKETKMRYELTKAIQAKIYPGIRRWKENLVVGKSKNLLIRVDRMTNDNLRYVCWSNGKPDSEKPDLILFNGTEEFQGAMGGQTFTFKNGDWNYIIDQVDMCEDDRSQNCGLFLRLLYKGTEKNSIKLTETK